MNAGQYTKEKWGGGITPRLPFHYPIPFIPSLTYIRCIFIVKRTGWRHVESNCRSNVITSYIHGLYIYRRIRKFFQTSRQMLLSFKWLFLWVSQSLMSLNSRHRNCVIYGYLFCVYWSEMLCAHLYVPPIHECRHMYARCIYVNPDVEFLKKVSKIVFYEILNMFGINFTTKTKLFTRLWY